MLEELPSERWLTDKTSRIPIGWGVEHLGSLASEEPMWHRFELLPLLTLLDPGNTPLEPARSL